jgi:7,8-dihydropterin-6-yl-methyl-4-(beta-D-ribofuranosyl)aminobenzene 5'-phosphate synthase
VIDLNIIVLIENSKGKEGLTNEFGLSLHIEANGKSFLFDTGASSSFAKNAGKLNLDLGRVDMAVLSHGHYDHGGGIAAFFAANETAPLYLRTTADGDHYGKSLFNNRYIGLDRAVLKANQTRLRWINEDTEIAPGLFVLTSIPDEELKPNTVRRIVIKQNGRFAPDSFRHELVFVVKEEDGISVITGCGHLGVLNMVLAAKRKFPEEPIKAVIGGFHLISNPITGGMAGLPADIDAMARRFKELGCQMVISGHCTGKKASAILKRNLRKDYIESNTGITLKI